MPLNEYINKNIHELEIEHSEDEQSEDNDINEEVEGESNDCTSEASASKRKRGKTKCKNVHARSVDDREEIILNVEGEPVGPNQKIVSELSSFLGTIARSADLCPLTYTNWKAIPDKSHIWQFVNSKYDIPEKGKKAMFAIIRDAWRRQKCSIKKNHFSKYKNMRDRLKNRPEDVPEAHFRELIDYWRLEAIKEISTKNARNIAQQKWRHRVGPISFACIRERLRASKEDGESPTQADIFIETRKSKKGKKVDEETNNVITKLYDLAENCGQSSSEAFKQVFGDERPG
uniref:Transposase n=1 Tax=Lotus japonicus TaxID=34305 RepID=I3SVN6_LOTJA|nr:unknown [Lotus japonicus]